MAWPVLARSADRKNQDDVFHVVDPELLAGLLNSDE
jgi:hypothetical protein